MYILCGVSKAGNKKGGRGQITWCLGKLINGPRQVMDPGQVMGLRQVRGAQNLNKTFFYGYYCQEG